MQTVSAFLPTFSSIGNHPLTDMEVTKLGGRTQVDAFEAAREATLSSVGVLINALSIWPNARFGDVKRR